MTDTQFAVIRRRSADEDTGYVTLVQLHRRALVAEVQRLQADNQRLCTGIADTIEHIGETAVWTQPLLAMLAAQRGDG